MGRYQDKVVIVTGGSKGIGEGCVRVFVEAGAKVSFCARGEADGIKLQTELNEKGPGECFFIKCDMSDEQDIRQMINKTLDKFGRLDCLINNAGWHPEVTSIDDFSVQDFKDLLNLNLVSYFTASKYALPELRKTKGNIINVSSLVGQIGQPGATTYVATKGGISAFTRALAIDEAKYEVRVNTLSPGNVWTPLWEGCANACDDPARVVQAGNDAQLIGRMGTIEEMGQVCLFLAAEGTFCTGIDLLASGGAELSYGIKNQVKSSGSKSFIN